MLQFLFGTKDGPLNPRDDWKLWLVVNPKTWLLPILVTVMVVSLAIHVFVYSNPNYNPLHSGAVAENVVTSDDG